MAATAHNDAQKPRTRDGQGPTKARKLERLPDNARVTKRPLLRPPIPSPYTDDASPKVIYISAKTPFLSAVKRAEKLLRRAEGRQIRSATTLAKNSRRMRNGHGGRRVGGGKDASVDDIVRTLAEQKAEGARLGKAGAEEVSFKGTGKAIAKVMELGLWFQQRDQYVVRLHTGTTNSIDDIVCPEKEAESVAGGLAGDLVDGGKDAADADAVLVESTRIRQLSVLEVRVSMR